MGYERKGGWGGKRPGSGRKPKGSASRLSDIDVRAAEATEIPVDISDLAQPRATEALAALVKQLTAGKSEAARVAAANTILDRGYGRPSVDLGGEARDLLAEMAAVPIIDDRFPEIDQRYCEPVDRRIFNPLE